MGPPNFLHSLRDLKKCLGKTEVDFGQKLEISILISKKFGFFIFSSFLFACTFERVKVAKKVKNAKIR